jgi:hypothetical protein
MRAMLKGDRAFFYRSNCKVPGIVGVMEVVGEHTIDGEFFLIYNLIHGLLQNLSFLIKQIT